MPICRHCLPLLPDLTQDYEHAFENLLLQPSVVKHINHSHYEYLFALSDYRYPWDYMIHQLKYNGHQDYATILASFFYQRILSHVSLPDVIVPVPLHPRRYIQRQFNQTHLVAKQLANYCGLPLVTDWLIKIKHTAPQKTLSGTKRRSKLAGCFTVTSQRQFSSIALVDDVLTTGQTINACCNVIKNAYPNTDIYVWVVCLRLFRKVTD